MNHDIIVTMDLSNELVLYVLTHEQIFSFFANCPFCHFGKCSSWVRNTFLGSSWVRISFSRLAMLIDNNWFAYYGIAFVFLALCVSV